MLVVLVMHALLHAQVVHAHQNESKQTLTEKQKAITLIASYTAKGELTKLKQALITGLDAFLTDFSTNAKTSSI